MKKLILLAAVTVSILSSCDKYSGDVFLRVGDDLEFRFSDIELYDTSTHIIYFRTSHEQLNDLEKGTFVFIDNNIPIYTGNLWPGYSSTMPQGPYIMVKPSLYGDFALRIDCRLGTDLRKNPEIISLLKANNLLHSGLSITSGTVETSSNLLIFRFRLLNRDETDLLILDPEKTGPGLFHYFTNGLYLYNNSNNQVFSGNIEHVQPNPWNEWKAEWLSVLASGESREFTISYPLQAAIAAGEYRMVFSFPGLAYQVKRDELLQGNARIWLGDVTFTKKVILP